jgi:hypothetical protein
MTQEFLDRSSEVPWAQIVGLRNILVHEYFGVNFEQVWMVLVRDLPMLRPEIKELIERLRTESREPHFVIKEMLAQSFRRLPTVLKTRSKLLILLESSARVFITFGGPPRAGWTSLAVAAR